MPYAPHTCTLALGVATSVRAADADPKSTCGKLAGLSIPASAISLPTTGATVTAVALVAANATGNANGEYCKVMGAIHPVDLNNLRAPDIRWQVNLPTR